MRTKYRKSATTHPLDVLDLLEAAAAWDAHVRGRLPATAGNLACYPWGIWVVIATCRFIRQIEGPVTQATVRVETEPGQEAQVDFGYAGLMYDPAVKGVRKSWAFVMTLSWSRHQYVEWYCPDKVDTQLRYW